MNSSSADRSENPLLHPNPLPRFDEIRAEHVVPGVRSLLEELERDYAEIESSAPATWAGLCAPLERISDRLGITWGTVTHLMSVCNTPELREAHQQIHPEVVSFSTRCGQSRPVYDKLCALRDGPERDALDSAQQRILEDHIKSSEHAGVGLDGAERERFGAIQKELAELHTRFSNNLLDSTKAFSLELSDAAEVEGLPPTLRELAAQSARESGHEAASADAGPWRFTLDIPSYVPFLQHSRRRELRERMVRSYVQRASSGEHDNTPVLRRILELRREKARLLGFDTYAELSLDRKMAPDVAAVDRLDEELRTAAQQAARDELEELKEFARSHGAEEADDLRQWDIPFWAERLREERFGFTDEELRPYFPLPRVLDGLFALAHRLFGVTVRTADGTVPVWHESVRYFDVIGEDGARVASFYLDPYTRPAEKRGGAWMDDCVGRTTLYSDEGLAVRLPVAYLVCNQTPPVDDKPSLMSFDEVLTLFHEFGHGLQHMLTTVDLGDAAGIRNVEWDAVELPSQFMENWCYHRPVLQGLGCHFQTGEPLPEELVEKLLAARNYRIASGTMRQLYIGAIDMELHHRFDPTGEIDPFAVQRRIQSEYSVLEPLPEDRFLCSFAHVFSGGYAAGYYSYKWAEVLSADAFAAFEEAGLEDEEAVAVTGRRFRDTVLALGGSRHPMDVFRDFRGREPSSEALLRHNGLLRKE